MELDRTEARVLGALVEKRWTVPDQYPLSLNALLAACNQKSNRNPLLHLAEFEVSGCLLGLRQRGLVVVHEQFGGRVPRHAEKLMDELRLSRQEMAILAELLLRGPQTPGELLRRCARMAHFENEGRVEALLRDLADGHFVRLQPKAGGQRHARWQQILYEDRAGVSPDDARHSEAHETPERHDDAVPPVPPAAPTAAAPTAPRPAAGAAPWQDELAALRTEIAALRQRVETLEGLV